MLPSDGQLLPGLIGLLSALGLAPKPLAGRAVFEADLTVILVLPAHLAEAGIELSELRVRFDS